MSKFVQWDGFGLVETEVARTMTYESRTSTAETIRQMATARRTGEVEATRCVPGSTENGRLKYLRAWAPVGRPQAICLMIPESVIMGLEWQ